ncbi:hypothetical protein V8V91_27855 [Algoriphagus halophilus]|uniref:hypothetical protein n=1 Tax=Algoriphagus halophilus TaxID=226505 RepID=UPI003A7414CB
MEALTNEVSESSKRLDEAQKVIDKVMTLTKDVDTEEAKELAKAAKEIKKKLDTAREAYNGPTREGQGIIRNLYPTTMTMVFAPRRYVGSSYSAPGATEERLYLQGVEAAAEAKSIVDEFINGDWKAFEEKVKNTQIDLFENMK